MIPGYSPGIRCFYHGVMIPPQPDHPLEPAETSTSRRRLRPSAVAAIGVVSGVLLIALAWSGWHAWQTEQRERIVVVIAEPGASVAARQIGHGAKQAGRDLGLQVEVIQLDADPRKAVTRLSRVIESRPAGICLPAVLDEADSRPLVTLAHRRGIAVTALWRDLPRLRRELAPGGFGFVGSDADEPTRGDQPFAQGYLAVIQIMLHRRYGIPGLLMRPGASASAPTVRPRIAGVPEIVLFAGGDEGHPFSDRVIQGARAAETDFDCQVTVVHSGWNRERMVEQLDEVLTRRPAAICFPGHPGEAVLAERITRAREAGILFTSFNVDLPAIRAEAEPDGFGFVGADQQEAGRLMAESCLRAFAVQPGEHVVVLSVHTPAVSLREVRARAVVDVLRAAGVMVDILPMPRPVELSGDLNAEGGLDFIVALAELAATSRVLVVDSPNLAPHLRPALRRRGNIEPPHVACFDLDGGIVAAMDTGDVELAIDQLPFVQGYGTVLQACLSVRHDLPGIAIETGHNVVTPATVHRLAARIGRGVR